MESLACCSSTKLIGSVNVLTNLQECSTPSLQPSRESFLAATTPARPNWTGYGPRAGIRFCCWTQRRVSAPPTCRWSCCLKTQLSPTRLRQVLDELAFIRRLMQEAIEFLFIARQYTGFRNIKIHLLNSLLLRKVRAWQLP
jgi:hypothetical protein